MTSDRYDAEADAAWETDPKAAFKRFGLPCWCGHYGGCEDCFDLPDL